MSSNRLLPDISSSPLPDEVRRPGSSSKPSAHHSAGHLSARRALLAKSCVIITVILERAAYYCLMSNLVLYMNAVLQWAADTTTICFLVFTGMTWISCFIGGTLGDFVLGRFKATTVGLALYFIGYASIAGMTYAIQKENVIVRKPGFIVWFVMSLLGVSLGEGCFKSNMSPFGADQVANADDKSLRTFFNSYYWAINLGSLIGYGPLALLLQINRGFVYGYLTAAGLLFCGLLVFLMPTKRSYHINEPVSAVLSQIWNVMKEAKKIKKSLSQSRSLIADGSSYEKFVPVQHWLDRAMVKYGGKYLEVEVEEVKTLWKTIPFLLFLVPYCLMYYQISGLYLLQGLHMKSYVFTTDIIVPASWLCLFNILFVLMFVPIVDRGLYPCLDRLGFKFSYVHRMAFGMALGCFSMIYAGLLETTRMRTEGVCYNSVGGKNFTAKDISIFYQIPQYGLMGISEIFVLIAGLELAYTQSPRNMRGFMTGLFYMVNGFGSILSSILLFLGNALGLNIISDTQPTDSAEVHVPPLHGNLHYFFYFLVGLNVVNLVFFLRYGSNRRKVQRSNHQSQHTIHDLLSRSKRRKRERNGYANV